MCGPRALPQVVTLDVNCGSQSLVALHPPRSRWLIQTRDVLFVRLPLLLSRVPLLSCMLPWTRARTVTSRGGIKLCASSGPFLLLLEIVWCSLMRMLGWEVSALLRWVLVTRSCSPPMETIFTLCWVRFRSRRLTRLLFRSQLGRITELITLRPPFICKL